MAPIAERVRVFVLVCGLVLFIPLGIVAKQSMATTFILVASILIVTTLFLSPQKLIPNKSIVYGFSVFCLYACIIHFVTVECIPCKSLLLTKISMLGLVLWVTSLDLSRLDFFPESKISWTLNISLFLASIFLIIEFLNDAVLYRWLSDRINDPEVALSRYNRVTSALVLFVWPVSYWTYQKGNTVIAISLIIVTFCAALLSHSNSAQVVSVLIPLVAILGYFLPTFVFWSGFFPWASSLFYRHSYSSCYLIGSNHFLTASPRLLWIELKFGTALPLQYLTLPGLDMELASQDISHFHKN